MSGSGRLLFSVAYKKSCAVDVVIPLVTIRRATISGMSSAKAMADTSSSSHGFIFQFKEFKDLIFSPNSSAMLVFYVYFRIVTVRAHRFNVDAFVVNAAFDKGVFDYLGTLVRQRLRVAVLVRGVRNYF